MKIRDATVEDMKEVSETSISRGIKEQITATDYVYALEDEGVVLCVGGIKMMNETSAFVWIDMAAAATKQLIVVYRTLWDWMDTLIKVHNIQRLMAAVICDFNEAIRMVEHLGFKRESTMRNWKNGKDAYLYVRFKES